MTKPGKSSNWCDPEKLKGFVGEIEGLHEQRASAHSVYMDECKGIKEQEGEVYLTAKAAGVPKRALRSVIQVRAAERRAENIRAKLTAATQNEHDQIRHAIGDLADTPLGQAALAKSTNGPQATV